MGRRTTTARETSTATATLRERLVPVEEVCARLAHIHRSTLWRMVKRGQFPKPKTVTGHRIGWRESELRAWMQGDE